MNACADKLNLYLAHRPALVDYATHIIGCRARAEDIVQDAWLRFGGQLEESLAIHNPVAYLYRIVRNLAYDLSRRLATERRQPDGHDALADIAASDAGPEQQAASQDELQALTEALGELPERTRQAFEMHRLGGFTLHQIADTLKVSPSLVHQLVHDALSHCMDRLER